jgi:peptidoglycan hydrolase CwlO-like protein
MWFWSHILPATKFDLMQFESVYMATQTQLAADLKAVLEQQKKTSVEITALQGSVDTLNTKITELEAVISAGGEASQELTDAVAAVKAQAQVVDDQIPDLPEPPPTP